jgi:chaperonin GroES
MIDPLHDYLYIRLRKAETETEEGIALPQGEQDTPHEGEVLAVGPEVKKVKKGDRVVFKAWGANQVHADGKEAILIRESDILGIIRNESRSSSH